MGAIALAAVGLGMGMGAAGTAMQASSAKAKRNELSDATGKWLPNVDENTSDYFSDLRKYFPGASALSADIGKSQLDQAMQLREAVFPGINQGTKDAMGSILPLLRGELPQGVMDAYSRAGGASTVGSGMGGSGFGFLNTGLFGARGALGGMETGMGLLGALMSTGPKVEIPTAMTFLSDIMNPGERTSMDMSIRGQNLGISQAVAGMPTSKDTWGGFLSSTGGTLTGMGTMGLMGGGGGGGGMATSGVSAGGYKGMGPAGGFPNSSPWGSGMVA